MLGYLEACCCSEPSVANIAINSAIAPMLVRGLSAPTAGPGLQARLATVLGLLLRHATQIADDLAATGAQLGPFRVYSDNKLLRRYGQSIASFRW